MELDYHYYAIYQLAKLAGYGAINSETIAYASQYVDDSTEGEPVEPFPDQHFDTVRTAHYNLGAFSWDIQKKVYMPFHFLPDKIRWKSPENFSYVTVPAQKYEYKLPAMIFNDALNETNKTLGLIRIGIAVHTIADTFSHFGFSGRHHNENNVGKIWHMEESGWESKIIEGLIGDIFAPRIGHAEAFKFPDQPFLIWKYKNDKGDEVVRDNAKESIKGAKLIYHFLKTAKDGSDLSSDFEDEHPKDFEKFKTLFNLKEDLRKRCDKWIQYTGAPKYTKTAWRKDALKGNVKWDDMSRSDLKAHISKLKGKEGFETSKWAYFHRAAFKQRNLVLGWLN